MNEDQLSVERDEEEMIEPKVARNFVVPDSKIKLLACDRCRLIKSEVQWKNTNGCENCKHTIKESDYKRFTSAKIDGMVSLMETSRSWLRKKINLSKNLVPGLYAVELL